MIPMARIIFGENILIDCSRQSAQAVLFVLLCGNSPIRLIDSRYHGLAFILRPPPGLACKMQTPSAGRCTCRLSSLPAKYALPRESL